MRMTGRELLFAAADATWRCEAAKVLDREPGDFSLILLPEARGEPNTLLRVAFEARERAYANWCLESETVPVSEACPVSRFRADRA